ncbi:MAG: LysE family translocator [Alphaproteobacteria bacterium]
MEIYFIEFANLFCMNFLNLASPGPETALMIHNSSHYSRKIGLYTGFGIVCSTFIHKTYSILGFGKFVAQHPALFTALKYAGSLYLLYLAFKMFRSKGTLGPQDPKYITYKQNFTPKKAFKMGFTIDILHPQASLAFISIFASTVSVHTPFYIQAIYGLLLVLSSLCWYSLLAVTSSQTHVKYLIHKGGIWINRAMGTYMVYFAYKLSTRTLH